MAAVEQAVGVFGKLKGFLPAIFLGFFFIIQFFIDAFTHGVPYAFQTIAETLFAGERIINQNVQYAILNAPQYNLWSFIQIIVSLFMIYEVIKFLTWIQIKFAGATAEGGAIVISIIFFCIIEMSVIRIVDGKFGFIPLWNGVIFLFINIGDVFMNIFRPAANIVIEQVILNSTQK